jgi:hypothetical protein
MSTQISTTAKRTREEPEQAQRKIRKLGEPNLLVCNGGNPNFAPRPTNPRHYWRIGSKPVPTKTIEEQVNKCVFSPTCDGVQKHTRDGTAMCLCQFLASKP